LRFSLQEIKRQADFALDEWQSLFEDLQNRLVSMEAQMKQQMQQQEQMVSIELVEKQFAEKEAGIELVQRQFADAEERFMAAVNTKIGRRMRKVEEDIRQLINANQLVTTASPEYHSRLDSRSPRLDSRQPTPRPNSASDSEDRVAHEAQGYSTFRNGTQWASSILGITTPVLSSRQEGSSQESHRSNVHSRLPGPSLSARRYQACVWP